MQHSPALQQIDVGAITSTSPPWPLIATSNYQQFIVRIDAVDDCRKPIGSRRKASRCPSEASSEGRRKPSEAVGSKPAQGFRRKEASDKSLPTKPQQTQGRKDVGSRRKDVGKALPLKGERRRGATPPPPFRGVSINELDLSFQSPDRHSPSPAAAGHDRGCRRDRSVHG